MKTTTVTINDAAPTLIAKGPGRFRFRPLVVAPYIGGSDVTGDTGFPYSESSPELILGHSEKAFAIAYTGQGSGDVIVLEYGTP
jgi:hypothetical protein